MSFARSSLKRRPHFTKFTEADEPRKRSRRRAGDVRFLKILELRKKAGQAEIKSVGRTGL
jgi:hypothetical protein